MELTISLELAQFVFGIIMEVAIVIIYTLNIVWLHKIYNIMDRRSPFLWMGKALVMVSLGFIVAFGYLLVSIITNAPIGISLFGVMFIRPLIFTLGCIIGGTCKLSLKYLNKGGYVWISRRHKI